MIRVDLNDREVQILELRKRGKTFKEISEIVGCRHYQQVQAIYKKALKKLHTFRDIQKDDPQLLKAASEYGFGFAQLSRLYSVLQSRGIDDCYKTMQPYELAEIHGIGEEYLQILLRARALS